MSCMLVNTWVVFLGCNEVVNYHTYCCDNFHADHFFFSCITTAFRKLSGELKICAFHFGIFNSLLVHSRTLPWLEVRNKINNKCFIYSISGLSCQASS